MTFNGSCYYRTISSSSRASANSLCSRMETGAQLVSINSETELYFLMYHISRPHQGEWLGPQKNIERDWLNPDGSIYTPTAPHVDETFLACLSLQPNLRSSSVAERDCSATLKAVCEKPLSEGASGECPRNWLQTQTHCYLPQVDTPLRFEDADEHCATVYSGARLAYPTVQGMANVLVAFMREAGAPPAAMWAGVKREGEEFSSVTGGPWSLTWSEGTDLSSSRDCVRILQTGKGDLANCRNKLYYACGIVRPAA